MINDKYLNDRLNYILLTTKKKDKKLRIRERIELNRLISKGYNIGEGEILEYAKILQKKSYVNFKSLPNRDIELSITETGNKALKYNHLPSKSKKERNKVLFNKIQRLAILISIPASLIAMFLSVKSCNSQSKIESMENRIHKIEQTMK